MQQKYIHRIELHETNIKKHNTLSKAVGYTKLLLVFLLGISTYFIFSRGFPIELMIIGVVELIVLTVFWIYHDKLREKIAYSSGIVAINKRHMDRLSGRWTAFDDLGAEFADPEHPYACDLDIVGKNSFFQFLNTTHTWHGRQTYAQDLLQPHYTKEEIGKRQKAISELSKDVDFSSHMEYYFSKIGTDSSTQNLVAELQDQRIFLKNKALKLALNYVPLLTFVFIAIMLVFQQKNLYPIGFSFAIVQFLIWVAGMSKPLRYVRAISQLPYKLSAYSRIIDILKNKDFASERLKEIQEQLGGSQLSAKQAIKELSNIADKVNARRNGVVCFVLNVLFLWDYKCAVMYQEWKMKYAHVAESWFFALGEFESLLCFSNLPNICNNTCLPIVVPGKIVSAEQMGHPLISNNTCVNNDVSCDDSIFIISGSNMSGKTTFQRAVGINLVLGSSGSFTCARQMNFSPMEIVTSMRISDDLNEGISTFYAELKRIKSIIELAEKGENMIFLIDEIFKGTNSTDRLSGAKTVISKLNGLGAVGMITTHDLDLCEISSQYPRIENYSFSEYYRDNEICFDYKIKLGKSNTTNATYLMKMVGIV